MTASADPNTAVELAVLDRFRRLPFNGCAGVGRFAFTTPADLTAGTSYAVTVTQINSPSHQHMWWAGSSGDTYAGGEPFDTRLLSGDFAFETYMIAAASASVEARARAAIARPPEIPGRTAPRSLAGTFLDLADGQPATGHYKGATSAYYLEGLGISCVVPAGYAHTDESVGYHGHGDPGPYPYYGKTR